MKNRTWSKVKNGRFFCWHDWKPNGEVGMNWDISFGVKVPVECYKCGKIAEIPSWRMGEWPDELINPKRHYR